MNKIVKIEELEKRLKGVVQIPEDCDFLSAQRFQQIETNKLLSANQEFYFPFFSSSNHPKKGVKLYRVSKYFPAMNIENLSSFSYPPKNIAKGGRCNIPKNPVFYCSHQPYFSLLEILQGKEIYNANEIYFLSEWEVVKNSPWKMLGIILDKSLPKTNYYYPNVEKYYDSYLQKFINQGYLNEEFLKQNSFLNTQFLKINDHRFSAISSYEFLYGKNGGFENDIIIYPSVQGERNQCNLAINATSLGNGDLKFNYAVSICINNFIKPVTKEYVINFFGTGKAYLTDDNILQWKEIKKDECYLLRDLFNQNYDSSVAPITFF